MKWYLAVTLPERCVAQNEAGAVDGRPRVVRPHRDFRLFLAMNPRHGEVSRAMRNRGVELYLLPEAVSTSDDDGTGMSTQVRVDITAQI